MTPSTRPPGHAGALRFGHLSEANLRRCESAFHSLESWSLTDWATAMAGECGEACNVIKKIRRLDIGSGFSREDEQYAPLARDLADEIADLVIYADLLAARAGIDLGEAIRRKFNEVSERVGSGVFL